MIRIFTLVEADADGKALHDFDEIAGGVFGRQEAHHGAGGAGHVFDVAVKFAAVGVNVDIHLLVRAHSFELSFLEIRGDPDVTEPGDGHWRRGSW